jgi:hypothetical protein
VTPDVLDQEEVAVEEQSQAVPEGGTARVVPSDAFADVAFDRDFTGAASQGGASPYFSQLQNLKDMVTICNAYAPEPVGRRILYVRFNVEPHLTFDVPVEYPEQAPRVFETGSYRHGTVVDAVGGGDVVTVVEAKAPLTEAAPQLALAEAAEQMRGYVDLPVEDLASMVGLRRRQYYNLMRGKATSMKSSEGERRLRLLHRFLGELHGQLEDARAVRGAVLMPLDELELRSFFDVAAEAGVDDLPTAYHALSDALSKGATPRTDRLAPSNTVAADDPRWADVADFLREQRAADD